ncbi:GNAT family N-acetyltransferase [Mariniluteicoccus endophyticus]
MIDPDLTLTGRLVRLEPLRTDHCKALEEAAADGELWDLFYTSVPEPGAMAADIQAKLALKAAGTMMPFVAVRLSDDQVLGMTTYCNVDPSVPKVEIGYTWNRASTHGSGTNPDSKLLLIGHAFEVLGCESVVFRTNFMNRQSREAIARLGARQDGVLRNDTRDREGNLRDTVQFSILPHEWPPVRSALERRVQRHLR